MILQYLQIMSTINDAITELNDILKNHFVDYN